MPNRSRARATAAGLPPGAMLRWLQASIIIFLGLGAPSMVQAQPERSAADLPLRTQPVPGPTPTIALLMSGDGNWARFVSDLSEGLVAQGIPVVGLESRSYLSRKRTPAEVARDMEGVLRRYIREWSAERVLIIGFSRGAGFAPFVVEGLSDDLRATVSGSCLLDSREK